jgi:hypothetical protein
MRPLIEIQFGSLIISLTIALVVTYNLTKWNKIGFAPPTKFHFSNTYTYFPITTNVFSSYFVSRGKLYVSLWSKYINSFKQFQLEMSLDKNKWLQIHPLTYKPKIGDTSKYTCLGYVDLSQLQLTIYGRILVPPQNIILPSDVTIDDVFNDIKGGVWVKPIKTPKDWTLLLIVFTSLLSACYGILTSILSSI